MPLVAPGSDSKPRELIPPGTYVARCVWLIDLGTQDDSYQGKPKITPKVRITWELPTETRVFDEKKGEQPFFISKKYTNFLSDRSNLSADLISWRGRPFTPEEAKGFDLRKILGAPCMLSIIHEQGKESKKMREKITAITPIPKGFTCPPAMSELIAYDVSQGRDAVYESLHEFLKEDIAKCHEWRTNPASPAPKGETSGEENPFNQEEGESDEPPF